MTSLALAQSSAFVVNIPFAALDSDTASNLRQALGRLVGPARQLVLDMSRVRSLDSAGVGALAGIARRAAALGGDIKLCGLSRQVAAVAELVRMDLAFEIFTTREEAAEALGVEPSLVPVVDLEHVRTRRLPLRRRLALLPSWS